MFHLIRRWYLSGKWNTEMVTAAKNRGWVTEEEANIILNQD